MSRVEFFINSIALFHQMLLLGEHPIWEYINQTGTAAKISCVENGKVGPPNAGWAHWYSIWVNWGGKPMEIGQEGYFEG